MKKTTYNIIFLLCAIFYLVACSDSNVSDLRLNGDCSVESIKLDDYSGTMDLAARSITVRVPENYTTTSLKVTELTLSDGAQADMKVGDEVNMTTPHVLHVANGDVYLDWTINVVHDEAEIKSFIINGTFTGVIDQQNHTISVYVSQDVDITKLTPTITVSDNATISPESGAATDFTNPVVYTVTNNTASQTYTVKVTQIGKPTAVYAGLAASMDQLNMEEKTACQWMLANIPNSIYASFDDIKNGNIDLSNCKVIWWHFHKDGGVDGKAAFESAAPGALAAAVQLRDYYNAGGSFLFTRYATNMPAEIGAMKNDAVPNNCWGQVESDAETCSSPWSFFIQGHTDHALFQNLIMNSSEPNAVYTTDTGYRITNSTAQWHIGSDWGGYANYDVWRNETGAQDLGYGGDGAIVAWEIPASGQKGDIICIGSGCYDWYSVADVAENYHKNVATMTLNAFNYLMGKSKK